VEDIELTQALDAWLRNDPEPLKKWDMRVRQRVAAPSQETLDQTVDRRLREAIEHYQGTERVRQAVAQKHPELLEAESALRQQVFERYEQAAADPVNKVLYPSDPRFTFELQTPGGTKGFDIRLINAVATDIKAEGAHQRGRAEEQRTSGIGAVQTGHGKSVQHEQQVEAWDLISPALRAEIRNMIAEKAIPPTWPRTERALAKHYYEGLPEAKKQELIEQYRRGTRAMA